MWKRMCHPPGTNLCFVIWKLPKCSPSGFLWKFITQAQLTNSLIIRVQLKLQQPCPGERLRVGVRLQVQSSNPVGVFPMTSSHCEPPRAASHQLSHQHVKVTFHQGESRGFRSCKLRKRSEIDIIYMSYYKSTTMYTLFGKEGLLSINKALQKYVLSIYC